MENIRLIQINDISSPELDVYARLSEPNLVHINEPDLGLFIAESPNVILRALSAGFEPVSLLVEERMLEREAAPILKLCPKDIPIFTSSLEVLVKITGFQLTRGLLCAMRRKEMPSVADICSSKKVRRIAVLESVVNPTNVGAIMRSAAALNIDALLLTQDCADPLYRRAIRVSMGTVFQIPWTYIGKSIDDWYQKGPSYLRELDYKLIAMALKDDSVVINDPVLKSYEKLAIILGNEGYGLSDSTLSKCDHTVIIPMSHGVDSLNVAAASAVAFWELTT